MFVLLKTSFSTRLINGTDVQQTPHELMKNQGESEDKIKLGTNAFDGYGSVEVMDHRVLFCASLDTAVFAHSLTSWWLVGSRCLFFLHAFFLLVLTLVGERGKDIFGFLSLSYLV